MPTLAKTEIAKARMGVALSNTREDEALKLALDSAEEHLLDLYGYTLIGGSKTEILRNVRINEEIYLKTRPVSAVTSAVGRYRGSPSDLYTLAPDIIDGENGVIVLEPDPESYFPEASWSNYSPFAIMSRWRAQIWPVVTVIYIVTHLTEGTAPKALIDAIVDLGIYWHRRGGAGEHLSSNLGGIQETFLALGVPRWITARIPQARRLSVRVV